MKKKTEDCTFSEEDLKTAFERQSCKCHRCGKELKFEEHTAQFERGKKEKDYWSSHRFFSSAPYDASNCVILCNECGKKYIANKKFILSPNYEIINSLGETPEKKSTGAGIALAFFFGVFGLLYANWKVALLIIIIKAMAWAFCFMSMNNGVTIESIAMSILIGIYICSNRIFLSIFAYETICSRNNEIARLESEIMKKARENSEQTKVEKHEIN